MALGYREVMFIGIMLVVVVFLVGGIVWLIGTASKASKVPVRSVAERLAELEALRKAGQITTAEYEQQRAAIVSSI